ncbi:hypothetical protein [Amycolatopsis vastitatis]|uniref:hypothetical protein n=1 Tax=Amycolatopsis vastitatis TaxID=1905142 RepID=UPI00196A319C|nr:hypothetical protein [Amycolatopsis vastitatis]
MFDDLPVRAHPECCGAGLVAHESDCARLGNSQHQQARDRRCSGAESPVRPIAVRDGEHGAVGELAQNACRQVLREHVAVLSPFHEVGEKFIDWPEQAVDRLAVLATAQRQQHSVPVCHRPAAGDEFDPRRVRFRGGGVAPTRAGTSRPWNSPTSWSAKSAPACAPFVPDTNTQAQERTRITRASLNRPKAESLRHSANKNVRLIACVRKLTTPDAAHWSGGPDLDAETRALPTFTAIAATVGYRSRCGMNARSRLRRLRDTSGPAPGPKSRVRL